MIHVLYMTCIPLLNVRWYAFQSLLISEVYITFLFYEMFFKKTKGIILLKHYDHTAAAIRRCPCCCCAIQVRAFFTQLANEHPAFHGLQSQHFRSTACWERNHDRWDKQPFNNTALHWSLFHTKWFTGQSDSQQPDAIEHNAFVMDRISCIRWNNILLMFQSTAISIWVHDVAVKAVLLNGNREQNEIWHEGQEAKGVSDLTVVISVLLWSCRTELYSLLWWTCFFFFFFLYLLLVLCYIS